MSQKGQSKMPTDELLRDVTPEAEQVARSVRAWLQTYEGKPVSKVDVEYLGETTGLTISTVQAAYKTRRFIVGGYQAQYQFALMYKAVPTTTGERLEADEILNNYALWAEQNADGLAERLPEQCRFLRLNRNTTAALLGRDADGSEVHQIMFTLDYEVNV